MWHSQLAKPGESQAPVPWQLWLRLGRKSQVPRESGPLRASKALRPYVDRMSTPAEGDPQEVQGGHHLNSGHPDGSPQAPKHRTGPTLGGSMAFRYLLHLEQQARGKWPEEGTCQEGPGWGAGPHLMPGPCHSEGTPAPWGTPGHTSVLEWKGQEAGRALPRRAGC